MSTDTTDIDDLTRPLSREDVRRGLRWCYERHGELKVPHINEADELPFTHNAVYDHFGSMDAAREAIGVDPLGYRDHSVPEVQEVEDADSYVYVVRLDRCDGETYLYVGSVTNGKQGLSARMCQHRQLNGSCRAPVTLDDGEEMRGRHDDQRQRQYEFAGAEVILPYEGSKQEVLEAERRLACSLCVMHGTNVLGGR